MKALTLLIVTSWFVHAGVYAQDVTEDDLNGAPAFGDAAEPDRDPAALVITPRKRTYAGGADEEDLRVLPNLPAAEVKLDARTLQRDVHKAMFNQDLKEERHDDAEE